MRKSLVVLANVVLAFVAAACNGPGQETAPTPTSAEGEVITTTSPTSTSSPSAPTTTVGPGTSSTAEPSTTTTLPPLESLAYEEVAALEFPVEMVALPGSDIAYIALKDGQVLAYDGSEVMEMPVLDVSGQVRNEGERGFLSIALHPDDTSRFFAHYSDNEGDTVVSEFAFTSPTEIDPESEQVLLTVDQPAGNHNGGMIDVYRGDLYLGLGDGGGGGDTYGNGQNTDTLLGGLVQIPLGPNEDPALWQYGLRNPWRFWIDNDLIYLADVGQSAFEEINVNGLEQGVNYGWPITEGLHCFSPSSGCDTEGLTMPVVEVSHGDSGTCSITGGLVYRGQAIPELDGHYFYSDYCGGYLRSFVVESGEVAEETDWTDQVGGAGSVSGFGVDGRREMYVMTTRGVLKVVPVRG